MSVGHLPEHLVGLLVEAPDESISPPRYDGVVVEGDAAAGATVHLACGGCEDRLVLREVPDLDSSVVVDADELIRPLGAEVEIVNLASVTVSVDKEGEVVLKDPIQLAVDGSSNQFLLIIRDSQRHDFGVELSLVGQCPLSVSDR